MLRKLIAAACFALLAFAAVPSQAQMAVPIATCGTLSASLNTAIPHALYMDTSGNLCTAASVSASITGFPTSQSTGTPISVTTGGVTGTLPAGAVVVASNVGATNNAYCKLGASATTSDQMIPPSSWFAFTVGAATQLTCITSTSTTTVNMVGGSGLPTGSGGGGGSGGGSSSITSWGGGTLGAMATYGTSPGAVNVPGVNAFVTNTLAPGQAAAGSSSPVVVAKNSGTGSTVAGAAVGTAGTASAEVVTVQGIASMTPFLTTTTLNAETTKVIGTVNVAAAQSIAATQSGTWTVQPGNTANTTAWLVRPNDGTRSAIIDPCEANLQSYATGVITSATTTRIVAPSASNKTYACMFFVKASAADNVGVYEGTGGTCGTGKTGVLGGTTTANGLVLATGDGLLLQAGGKVAAMQTAGTNVDLCLETSTAGPFVYAIKYVQAP